MALRPILQHIAQMTVLLATMGGAAAVVYGVGAKDYGGQDGGKNRVKSISYIENKAYQAECASCHIGFLPGFLPIRSWVKLMDDLEHHFGENAALDDGPRKEILKYLVDNAADSKISTRRSQKIAKLISQDEAPIRITETPFWTRRHSSVRDWVWKRPKVQSKAKCDSCHYDANKGVFDDHDLHVPKNEFWEL